jgi:rhamnosyltransferase
MAFLLSGMGILSSQTGADGWAPAASVIIRTLNSARTLAAVLDAVSAQTVASEIIVVDSGSTDGTLEIASARAHRLIEIDARDFSFGRALNLGAAAATAPVHVALSSHSFPPDESWIERSLAKYERPDVAATSGAPTLPGSRAPLRATHFQTVADAVSQPSWGLSNTGASWRAEVWARFPFDEQLAACEDKEWGLRVLRAGWTIAIDPSLSVSDAHRRRRGLRNLYRRAYREQASIRRFASIPDYSLADLLREWMFDIPSDAPYRGWRRRLNYFRCTELLAKHRVATAVRRAPACSSAARSDGGRLIGGHRRGPST